jgi:Na+-driven multidrug efflux pump
MRATLTVRIILAFFLPLLFMTELQQLSHSIVHAFLARLADPKVILAAFSIAFAFNFTLCGFLAVSVQAGICFISDRRSFWALVRFFAGVAVLPFIVIELTGLTPLGDAVFGNWMGASDEATRQAKIASAILGLWIIPILIRNLTYALVMRQNRTLLITYATAVRLLSLAAFLAWLPFWLEGAAVGAVALVCCMTVETFYLAAVARPILLRLAPAAGPPVSYREVWRFSWPLMVTQSNENGLPIVVNFFLGRLAQPDLALAAFGVIYGMVRLILAPLRNLIQTTQTLVRSRQDFRVMLRFVAGLLLFFIALVLVLFYSPLREVLFFRVMGLTTELGDYLAPASRLTFLVAIFWGFSAMFRGILSAMRQTLTIAATAGLSLLVATLVSASTLLLPTLNGAVVGILATSGAFAAEALLLGYFIRRRDAASVVWFARPPAISAPGRP